MTWRSVVDLDPLWINRRELDRPDFAYAYAYAYTLNDGFNKVMSSNLRIIKWEKLKEEQTDAQMERRSDSNTNAIHHYDQ